MNKKELIEFLEKKITMDVGDKVYDVQNGYKTEILDIMIYIGINESTIEYILQSDNQAHNRKYLIKLIPENEEIVDAYITNKEKLKKITE